MHQQERSWRRPASDPSVAPVARGFINGLFPPKCTEEESRNARRCSELLLRGVRASPRSGNHPCGSEAKAWRRALPGCLRARDPRLWLPAAAGRRGGEPAGLCWRCHSLQRLSFRERPLAKGSQGGRLGRGGQSPALGNAETSREGAQGIPKLACAVSENRQHSVMDNFRANNQH